MELGIAHIVNLILVSIFVGTEFSIAYFIHPALSRLSQSSHLEGVQAIGRRLGKVMPIWIPLIIVSALPVLYFIGDRTSPAFWLAAAGTICIVFMLFVSLVGNVPINNQVIAWHAQAPPANWQDLRKRWDSLHQIRVALDIAALVLFLSGALSIPRDNAKPYHTLGI